uniref:RIKEN cDNA D630039A03 gene n=1 Tax=Jaculus jaculus TaxID=51337 RepID=A0A8C5KW40_JACJA
MKSLAYPCPALPCFWERGSGSMAEAARAQAPGQGPPVDLRFLRAQYEDLRRQHLMVLPKGTPAESMISAFWINKERKSSMSPDETDCEVEGMLEEADRSCHWAPESPWHTHLEMHCLVQTFHQESNHQVMPKVHLIGSEQHFSENNEKTQQITQIPKASQCQGQGDSTRTEAAGSSLKPRRQLLPSTKNSRRADQATHYPFPQRKTPRISQAARNLGLYGRT